MLGEGKRGRIMERFEQMCVDSTSIKKEINVNMIRVLLLAH
jgi:hypothetical protein